MDIRKLKGYPNHYRIGIGDYRVLFKYEKPDILRIFLVGRRSQAYENLGLTIKVTG